MKTGCLRYVVGLASGRQAESFAKHIFSPTNTWEASTYYVRDAQGNVMATYLHTTEEGEYDGQPVTLATYTVSEHHIYGSSHLGMDTTRIELLAYEPPQADHVYTTNADARIYELTNHLGNVLATFTARKLPTTDNGEVTGFMAHVTSLSDYYPFGSALAGRMVESGYRYGFNGMEREGEIHNPGSAYDFGARMYDGRLGRWWSVDIAHTKYPSVSPYVFTINNPILFVDYDGNDFGVYINHETKTIIIRAMYIVIDEDVHDAQAAVNHWMNTNGRFEYRFEDENGDQVVYNIQFNLEVVPTSSITIMENTARGDLPYEVRDNMLLDDASNLANSYMVADELPVPEDQQQVTHGVVREHVVKGGFSDITLKPGRQRQRKTGSHEVGHTLGLGHWSLGLMVDGEHRRDSDVRISLGMIATILELVGVGSGSPSGRDVQVELPSATAHSSREEHGVAPTGFDSGQVVNR